VYILYSLCEAEGSSIGFFCLCTYRPYGSCSAVFHWFCSGVSKLDPQDRNLVVRLNSKFSCWLGHPQWEGPSISVSWALLRWRFRNIARPRGWWRNLQVGLLRWLHHQHMRRLGGSAYFGLVWCSAGCLLVYEEGGAGKGHRTLSRSTAVQNLNASASSTWNSKSF